MPVPLPIVAVDFDVVGIIILVLSILGYFVKAIKGSGENVPRPPMRRPDGDRMKMEIETFLEELNEETRNRPAGRGNKPVPPAERPRPPAVKPAKKSGKVGPSARPPMASKSVASLADKHFETSKLGQGVRSHVSGYMQSDRIASEVKQDLASRIPSAVQADLGPASATAAGAPSPPPVHPVVRLLRDPQGVRQAIALQEILQKPKALRRS